MANTRVKEIKNFLVTARDVSAYGLEWFFLLSAFTISLLDSVANESANWLIKKAEALNRRRLNIQEGTELKSRRTGLEINVAAVEIVWPNLARKRTTAGEVVDIRSADYPANEADASTAIIGAAAASVVVDGSLVKETEEPCGDDVTQVG